MRGSAMVTDPFLFQSKCVTMATHTCHKGTKTRRGVGSLPLKTRSRQPHSIEYSPTMRLTTLFHLQQIDHCGRVLVTTGLPQFAAQAQPTGHHAGSQQQLRIDQLAEHEDFGNAVDRLDHAISTFKLPKNHKSQERHATPIRIGRPSRLISVVCRHLPTTLIKPKEQLLCEPRAPTRLGQYADLCSK